MLETLTDFISDSPLTYGLVALLVAGDAIIPVFPGESAVVAAAVLAADGELMVWLVLAAAFVGAFVGDVAMYGIGRWAGTRRCAATPPRATGRRGCAGRGGCSSGGGTALIVAAQFIPGGRNVVMFSAGTLHYPLRRFVAAEALGAALWASSRRPSATSAAASSTAR